MSSPRRAELDLGLRSLFDPDSVAVVGASDDPAKWGHILSRRALESVGRRPVLLVNARGTVVLGRPTYRTLAEARRDHGRALDLVVVCVPAAALVGTVAEAVEAGARAVVVITAGFSELGAEGARLEQEAVAIARAAGAVLVGPNCLGVADTGTDLQLSHAALPVGEVAVLSQSGNMVLDLGALFVERGLGVSRFVSLGNQAQLGVVELMRSCVAHADTRAVALYAEDVVDGRGFIAAARALREAGKPVVLLSPGRSAAAARSAISHTGSLTSPAQVVDAACAVAGVRRVDNPTQMADLLQGLLAPRRLLGDRVAALTDGGGHGAMAADALAAVGLDSPPLGEATRSRLREHLWASSTVANPVDLAGAGDRDPMNYARAVEALLEGDDVDAVLVTGYFGGYSIEGNGLSATELAAVHSIALAVQAQHKPVVVHTIFPYSPSAAVLRAAGIPVHRDIDRACVVLAGLVEGPLPEVAQEQVPDSARVTEATYESARALFGAAGVSFPSAVTVTARSELEAAFEATGFPVVLKALGTQHKSDGGGVVLGLPDEAAALAAYDDLRARLDPRAVSVETMAGSAGSLDAGVEVIAGWVRDPTFGPVLMVGLGGIYAEVLADTACALVPVSLAQVRDLLLSLRGAPLLLGARGRAAVDLDALVAAVAAVARTAVQHPELREAEVNPLLAMPEGTLALDARVVLNPSGPSGPDQVHQRDGLGSTPGEPQPSV